MSTRGSALRTPTKATAESKAQPEGPLTGREGKRQIAGWFAPEVLLQLKQIGLNTGDVSVQDMLRDALNDFFIKHGKKPIA